MDNEEEISPDCFDRKCCNLFARESKKKDYGKVTTIPNSTIFRTTLQHVCVLDWLCARLPEYNLTKIALETIPLEKHGTGRPKKKYIDDDLGIRDSPAVARDRER